MAATNNAAASFSGLYVQSDALTDAKRALPDAVYANPSVTGVSLRLVWNTIETGKGTFDWSTLDREVGKAVASGKQIALSVTPNLNDAPSWLFTEGVQKLTFVVPARGAVQSRTINIAAPWDATYQSEYGAMMQALSDHLKTIPGAYDAVSVVKVTGMDQITSETDLPSSSGGNGITDAVAVWQAAGYTPDKVVAAWKSFASSVNAAFSDKIIGIAILDSNGFPLIDNDGHRVTTADPSYVDVTKAIVSSGLTTIGDRFMVQYNALSAGKLSHVVAAAVHQGAIAGYQTNHFLAGGAGVGTYLASVAPTSSTYQAILDAGIGKGGAQYLEVWAADATSFGSALAEAKAAMTSHVYNVTGPFAGDLILNDATTTVYNAGAISGGVYLGDKGTVFNGAGGTVSGGIVGGAGADRIVAGNDGELIAGGAGHDTLTGGAGSDTFAFASYQPADSDTIRLFDVSKDTIQLDHTVFKQLAAGRTPVFAIGTRPSGSANHLFYNASTGALSYDVDGSGAHGVSRVIATLDTGLHLTAHNFTVV